MKKQYLKFISLIFLSSTILFAQENTLEKGSNNSTEQSSDKINVKDADGNLLIQFNDEGTVGSITIPDSNSAPAVTANKLYNLNGMLYYNGEEIGTSAAGGGWIDNGSVVCLSTGSDKVGLGTTNPQTKLSLGTDINPKKFAIWDGVGDFYGLGCELGRITFYANNNEKMTIKDNGNVGIGTSNPDSKLTIESPNNFMTLAKINQKGNKNYAGLRMDRENMEKWFIGMNNLNDNFIFRRNAASNDVTISSAGFMGIGTNSPSYFMFMVLSILDY